MLLVIVVTVAFLALAFGSQAWTIRRAWTQALASFAHARPHEGPIRPDAQALVDELTRLGFVPGPWLWLEPVRWACMVLQRTDGTRSVVLSGNRPPGYDISSELVAGPTLVTQSTAFTRTPRTNVRQALGGMASVALLAAHDGVLMAAGRPSLVVHPPDALAAAALGWERAALEETLAAGWRNAFATTWRAMFRQQLDTVPILERPADLDRLRPPSPTAPR